MVPALATWAGAFLGTGGSTAVVGWWGALGLGALAAARAALGARRASRRSAQWLLAAAVVGLVGGLAVAAPRVAALRGSGLAPLAGVGATARVTGELTGDPVRVRRPAGGGPPAPAAWSVPVRANQVEARGRRVRTRVPLLLLVRDRRWAGLLPGQDVVGSGRLAPPRTGQPVAALLVVRGPPELRGRPPTVQRWAGGLRSGLRRATGSLAAEPRGLLPGLVVGDTARLPSRLAQDMRTAGMTHLTAVSGANLAIVASFVLFAGRWVGLRGRWLPGSAALAIAGFVVLARPQPSVLRAGVMGAIGLVALATGRRRRSLSALCAAVLVLVLLDPWLARSFGFVLSALATGGLVLLAGGWARSWRNHRVPASLADALAVSLAAQLVVAPVVVLLSGQVSLTAVLANLLAAPAVPPATLLGVLVTVVAPVSPALAAALAQVAQLPAQWIAVVAHGAATVPGAVLPWPATGWGALVLAVLCAAALGVLRVLGRRPAAAAAAATLLAVALAVRTTTPGWPPAGWVLAACDVGQGDALVLAVAPRTAVVVDAGPDPRAVDHCLRRLDVRRVPMVLLTHLDADHVTGLPGVLRGRVVRAVATSAYPEPAGGLARVQGWTRRARVPLTRVVAGEQGSVGALSWQVLWPARVVAEGSVSNNVSLVLLVRSRGLALLLTGDVEVAAQRALLGRGQLPQVDVLKVAHHGSANQDFRLVTTTRPRLALVSVGAGNDYGHPAPATLHALRRVGAMLGRTDLDGTLVVVGGPRRLRLVRAAD